MKLEKFQISKIDKSITTKVIGGVGDDKKTFSTCLLFVGYNDFGYKVYDHTVTYDNRTVVQLEDVVDDSCKP